MASGSCNCAECKAPRPVEPGPCERCGSRARAYTIGIAEELDIAGTLDWRQEWARPQWAWRRRRQWGKRGTRTDAKGRRVRFEDSYDKDADRRLERVEDL